MGSLRLHWFGLTFCEGTKAQEGMEVATRKYLTLRITRMADIFFLWRILTHGGFLSSLWSRLMILKLRLIGFGPQLS